MQCVMVLVGRHLGERAAAAQLGETGTGWYCKVLPDEPQQPHCVALPCWGCCAHSLFKSELTASSRRV